MPVLKYQDPTTEEWFPLAAGATGPTGPSGTPGPTGPTGPAGAAGSAGMDQTTADARYVNIAGDAMTGPLRIFNTDIAGHLSGGAANDALKFVSNNAGAAIAVQNAHPAGYAGIEYIGAGGSVEVFTGYNNGNPGEFRFNNISPSNPQIRFLIGAAGEQLRIDSAGVFVAHDPTAPLGIATKQYVDSKPSGGGGGTTILDGEGPPAAAVGEIGDYYTGVNTLYGPKRTPQEATPQTVLTGTPAIQGGGAYVLGSTYRPGLAVRALVTGARFWRHPESSWTTRSVYLYDSAGLLVAMSSPSVESDGFNGWVEVTFPTPVLILPQQQFTVAYGDPVGYSESSGVPGVVDPEQMAWVTGRYSPGSGPGFPGNASGTIYFVDPVWHVDDPGAWPLAVDPPGAVATHEAATDPHPQYVNGTGDTMTGSLTIDGGMNLNAPAGTGRSMTFQTGWATRWAVGKNSVDDFSIGRYNDGGGWVADALNIRRADGVAAFAAGVIAPDVGANTVAAYVSMSVKGQPIYPWVPLTQAEYDALATKDPDTLYVVTDAAAV